MFLYHFIAAEESSHWLTWIKDVNFLLIDEDFDVLMGCYDGSEVCIYL